MKIKIEPDLLDWTSGKVKGFFSKELLNLDAGNLKLIKIDPYAIYPGHIHPEKKSIIISVTHQVNIVSS